MLGSDSSQHTDNPFFSVPQAFSNDSGESQLHYSLHSKDSKRLEVLVFLVLANAYDHVSFSVKDLAE